jgi:hypothetical protein
VEEKQLLQRVWPEAGFYPRFGGITIGGGLGFGAGYRRSFRNDTLRVDGSAMFSAKGYGLGNVEVSLPRLFEHTLEISSHVRLSHFPQEEFFGLGLESLESDRTNFLIDETEYATQLAWRPRPWLLLASQHALRAPSIGAGTDHQYASTDVRFNDAAAPGLTRRTTFLETGGLVEINRLDVTGNPRSGGRYVVYVSRFDDRHNRGFDFSRAAVTAERYISVFDAKRVLVFRAATNHLVPAAGSRAPFYYMLPFGGKDSIRGFDDLRFRDTNGWVINGEYRWEAFTGVDLALFYDRGGVAPRFRELSIRSMRQSYGLGVRLGTPETIFMRAEVAFGSGEGVNCYVAFGGPLKLERVLR